MWTLGSIHYFVHFLQFEQHSDLFRPTQKYAVKSESFDQPLAKIRLRIPGQGCECTYWVFQKLLIRV